MKGRVLLARWPGTRGRSSNAGHGVQDSTKGGVVAISWSSFWATAASPAESYRTPRYKVFRAAEKRCPMPVPSPHDAAQEAGVAHGPIHAPGPPRARIAQNILHHDRVCGRAAGSAGPATRPRLKRVRRMI